MDCTGWALPGHLDAVPERGFVHGLFEHPERLQILAKREHP
ncbi:MAG: hypothetical protein OXG06_06850 [Gammaproteobacteria bacterium]|nr:hypothetical protein [Gammaproteobacteria bacterium]